MLDVASIIARTAQPEEALGAAVGALARGQRAVVATVVSRKGSAPCTPGQKLTLLEDGSAVGTVGGGAVERAVLASMVSALSDPKGAPRVSTFRLGPSLGMCCGGSADILVEPLAPALSVLIVGAGHVGIFLAPLVASLGFRVTIADAREPFADASRLPQGAGVRLVHAEHDDPELRQLLPQDLSRSAMFVMTHDHQLDQAAIEWALREGFGLVGGVGSRAKAAKTRDRLEAKGFSEGDIKRVRMPLGVDIGARSPAEIGVAIAAEVIAWRVKLLGPERTQKPEASAPSAEARADADEDA